MAQVSDPSASAWPEARKKAEAPRDLQSCIERGLSGIRSLPRQRKREFRKDPTSDRGNSMQLTEALWALGEGLPLLDETIKTGERYESLWW